MTMVLNNKLMNLLLKEDIYLVYDLPGKQAIQHWTVCFQAK